MAILFYFPSFCQKSVADRSPLEIFFHISLLFAPWPHVYGSIYSACYRISVIHSRLHGLTSVTLFIIFYFLLSYHRVMYTLCVGSAEYVFFFLEKKLLNIFWNYFFYLKVQSFRLIMENNFIQMAALAGHAVGHTIGTIFKHIIELYFTNGFTNIVLVGVTLISDGTPQIMSNRSSEPAKWHQLCGW